MDQTLRINISAHFVMQKNDVGSNNKAVMAVAVERVVVLEVLLANSR